MKQVRWDELNNVVVDEHGVLWEQVSYCQVPSVKLRKVGGEETMDFGVGGITERGFRPASVVYNAWQLVKKVKEQISGT